MGSWVEPNLSRCIDPNDSNGSLALGAAKLIIRQELYLLLMPFVIILEHLILLQYKKMSLAQFNPIQLG